MYLSHFDCNILNEHCIFLYKGMLDNALVTHLNDTSTTLNDNIYYCFFIKKHIFWGITLNIISLITHIIIAF